MEICKYCGNVIQDGDLKCSKCGIQFNPDEYKKHTAAIVIGYICSVIGFPLGLGGFIFGSYLITRPNKDVHKHGKIMYVINVILWIAILIVMFN